MLNFGKVTFWRLTISPSTQSYNGIEIVCFLLPLDINSIGLGKRGQVYFLKNGLKLGQIFKLKGL